MKQLLLALSVTLSAPVALFAQDLPAPVAGLGLSDVSIREKPRAEYGRVILGTLPGGAAVAVDLDRHDRIEEIEARGHGFFPIAAVAGLIPDAVRANKMFPAESMLEKVEFEDDGRIELDGRLSDGRRFDAEFDRDGRLLDLDID